MTKGPFLPPMFPDSCCLVSGPSITSTVVLKGSPENVLNELRLLKKTGTLEISFSQGGVGFMKFTQKLPRFE